MKKLLLLSILGFSITMNIYAQEVKIGVINAQEIVEKTQRGKEIARELESVQNKMQAEIKSIQDQVTKKEKYFNENFAGLDENEQLALSGELQDIKVHFARKVEDSQKEMQKLTNQRLEEFQKEVMPLIQQLGREMGFTLVLDISSSGIVYFDQTIDITYKLISIVDERLR